MAATGSKKFLAVSVLSNLVRSVGGYDTQFPLCHGMMPTKKYHKLKHEMDGNNGVVFPAGTQYYIKKNPFFGSEYWVKFARWREAGRNCYATERTLSFGMDEGQKNALERNSGRGCRECYKAQWNKGEDNLKCYKCKMEMLKDEFSKLAKLDNLLDEHVIETALREANFRVNPARQRLQEKAVEMAQEIVERYLDPANQYLNQRSKKRSFKDFLEYIKDQKDLVTEKQWKKLYKLQKAQEYVERYFNTANKYFVKYPANQQYFKKCSFKGFCKYIEAINRQGLVTSKEWEQLYIEGLLKKKSDGLTEAEERELQALLIALKYKVTADKVENLYNQHKNWGRVEEVLEFFEEKKYRE